MQGKSIDSMIRVTGRNVIIEISSFKATKISIPWILLMDAIWWQKVFCSLWPLTTVSRRKDEDNSAKIAWSQQGASRASVPFIDSTALDKYLLTQSRNTTCYSFRISPTIVWINMVLHAIMPSRAAEATPKPRTEDSEWYLLRSHPALALPSNTTEREGVITNKTNEGVANLPSKYSPPTLLI